MKSDGARVAAKAGAKSKLAKKPPGRPKKPEGEKLEQFSIRLTPKLKFGLELLARLQGRSLSQTIEWALHHSLANVNCAVSGEEPNPLLALLNSAWSMEGARRSCFINKFNPSLLPYEERYACRLLERSSEQMYVDAMTQRVLAPGRESFVAEEEERLFTLIDCWEAVIDWIWPALIADADELAIGITDLERPTDFSLCGMFFSGEAADHKRTVEERICLAAAQIKAGAVGLQVVPLR